MKIMKKITVLLLLVLLGLAVTGCAEDTETVALQTTEVLIEELVVDGFGAKGASTQLDLSIEEMLRYAIEDEYLARQEYESIMDAFGEQQPFSNIIRAEETHIELLKEIYESYEYEIPEDQAADHIILPISIEEALEIGVQAEINNIAMYEMFLGEELPDDIREVFIELRDASINHLAAFEKGPRGNASH